MINLQEFAQKVTAARASRAAAQAIPVVPGHEATAQSPIVPAHAAPMVPARSAAASWAQIAAEVNAEAGFAHGGPNVASAAPRRHQEPAARAPGNAGAAEWGAIAAIVNAEAGVTPNRSTGAR